MSGESACFNKGCNIAMTLSTLAHEQQAPGFDDTFNVLEAHCVAAMAAPNFGQQQGLVFNGNPVPEFGRLWRELRRVNRHLRTVLTQ
ncbi:MAG: hypothetical protein NTX54_09820 [Chloroflexi bacterium]|nr:hypothetical protein [Chloroflexota bacterium]